MDRVVRKISLATLLLILAAVTAYGQMLKTIVDFGRPRSTCVGYTGPGDVVSGASWWYGLRGYSCAVAKPGTNPAVNVRRASDNSTMDIDILNNGNFDSTTAASFAGTDATATCSTSGLSTTLSCTGASGTPKGFDPISGTGITQPAYVFSCGTFTGGAGSCTLDVARNISSTTVTFQVQLYVTKVYDQTKGNNCGNSGGLSCDAVQTATADQPQLLLNCAKSGTLPCLRFYNSNVSLSSANNFAPNAANKLSLSLVTAQQVWTSGGTPVFLRSNGTTQQLYHATSAANTWHFDLNGSLAVSVTASDGAWHADNSVGIAGTNNSITNLDGSETTGTGTPSATSGLTNFGVGAGTNGADVSYEAEGGDWDNLIFSSGQRSSMHSNQSSYWGTP